MGSVFLSHSSKDKDFVREVYRLLTRDGVNCFFDAESIGWGDNWVRALERALDECTDIVLVLSPDFCNSEWSQVERTSLIAGDPSGLKQKARPLLLRECHDLDTFPRFLKQVQLIDVSTQTLFEANYGKICRDLGGVPVPDFQVADRKKLPPVQQLPERHRMPYHSLGDKFFGRADALWRVYDALHRDGTTIVQGVGIVSGTGGLGKSQTAIEYAHRFGIAYQGGVYWVDADRGLPAMISQISEAGSIAIDTKAEEKQQLEQLWRGLNQLPPSLLVLDNFPEEIPLRPYLPVTGRIHTLVTTRRSDITDFPYVRLNTLSREAGIELLNSGARRFEEQDVAALVERLGGLPLALELTKSFLNYRADVSVRQVLDSMNKRGEIGVLQGFARAYKDELPSRHETDVESTFQMSWELAPASGQKVLRVMAELAPVGVPRKLLRLILGWKEPEGLDDELGEALSELARLSLVELDTDNNPAVHRLIHAFVRYRNEADRASPFEDVARVVLERMGTALNQLDGTALRELDSVVPHAEALIASERLEADDAIKLAGNVGWQHKNLGRLLLARTLSETALELAEKTYEAGHPSIALSQSNLALVLKDLGQLEEARDLLKEALASDEKTYEAGHASIAISQSNLATVLRELGQLEEARNLLKEALASDKKTYEAGHPSIAIRQSNLATVLRELGQLEEARDLLKEALASVEKTFKPGHPKLMIVQSNLAAVLQELEQKRAAGSSG